MGKHKHKEENEEEVAPEGEEAGASGATEPSKETGEEAKPYEELIALVNCIAKPLASKKLTKRLHKVVKKSQKSKRLKRGVREVVKGLRKGEKGLVVLAGDVSPIDVISHIPVFCEDKGVPYCYVPTRKGLGEAAFTKRPTSVVMIQSSEDYETLYQECYKTVDALPLPI
jgi:H/ACA ribonucleoprotein complex subunit 2